MIERHGLDGVVRGGTAAHRGRMHVEPEVRAALQAAGLGSFAVLMDGAVGELVHRSPGRSVRRVNWEGGAGYLKRTQAEPIGRVLKAMLRLAKPRNAAQREAALLVSMRRARLPVAQPLAWGARSMGPLPREGFILTREVPGETLHDAWATMPTGERLMQSRRVGALMGRLHASGFFHAVRFKDIIMQPGGELVLIDREVASPWAKRVTAGRCADGLTRSLAKLLRAVEGFGDEAVDAMWEGYSGELPAGVTDAAALRARVRSRVQRRMRHPRYAGRTPQRTRG